jgi:hypothetical protein
MKTYINAIRESAHGYDVHTSAGVYPNVSANVVRCAVGSDLDYLLRADINGREYAFPLAESDAADFLKYSHS